MPPDNSVVGLLLASLVLVVLWELMVYGVFVYEWFRSVVDVAKTEIAHGRSMVMVYARVLGTILMIAISAVLFVGLVFFETAFVGYLLK
jgi:hypothetical protein